MEKEKREIPFGKGTRVGNYKVWRSNISVGEKQTIRAVNISNLDQTWKVQIPETTQMYHALTSLYETGDERDRSILFTYLTNFTLASTLPDGHIQNALVLMFTAYLHPEVLDETFEGDKTLPSYDGFMDKLRDARKAYLDAYAERMANREEMSDKEYEDAAMADAAKQELGDGAEN